MDNETINRIIKNGNIPLGAVQVLGYIVENNNSTTTELIDFTLFPKVTLNRYVRLLEDQGYIIVNSKFKPFTYKLSNKGKQIWEGK